jgi:GNAT superfamily N-acetyltransferase
MIHRGYLPECIGRITAMHAAYYSEQVGFGVQFEAKVARELAEFCLRYDQARDGLWLAIGSGGIQGSIAIDGSHAAERGAHLRWFIMEGGARGRGLGRELLGAAIEFCRSRDYRRVYLWTFDGLAAARHLYESAGFRLAFQERGTQWGTEVDEQRFELQI